MEYKSAIVGQPVSIKNADKGYYVVSESADSKIFSKGDTVCISSYGADDVICVNLSNLKSLTQIYLSDKIMVSKIQYGKFYHGTN